LIQGQLEWLVGICLGVALGAADLVVAIAWVGILLACCIFYWCHISRNSQFGFNTPPKKLSYQ
jgi:hypothetical protein